VTHQLSAGVTAIPRGCKTPSGTSKRNIQSVNDRDGTLFFLTGCIHLFILNIEE
jgi:hypothetical protein